MTVNLGEREGQIALWRAPFVGLGGRGVERTIWDADGEQRLPFVVGANQIDGTRTCRRQELSKAAQLHALALPRGNDAFAARNGHLSLFHFGRLGTGWQILGVFFRAFGPEVER